jgi:hypothetical protein
MRLQKKTAYKNPFKLKKREDGKEYENRATIVKLLSRKTKKTRL